ncbi:MAG: hypothetical protein J2P17_35895, partial [Mycobacterium sp.]|nr:hypothetical protein [Mycobacterium sp.]
DIDINVEYDRQTALKMFDVYEWMRGKTTTAIKTALVGRTRKVQMNFEMRLALESYPGVTLVPLWRTGDSLDTALQRLHAITPDPTAGRAPREHMLPEFDGLDPHLPVYMRAHICKAVEANAIGLERLTLPDRRVHDQQTARRLDHRWQQGRPLNRAGHAVAAHFEDRGVDPGTVHLHGQDVRDSITPYFAGFAGRYLRLIPAYITEEHAVEHLEIPAPPTRTKPLIALRFIVIKPDWFAESRTSLWDA